MGLLLVVDDDIGTREMFRAALNTRGHHVVAAETVAQALTSLTSEPHLEGAIVDLRLPDGHGLEVLRAIGERRPKIRAVIVTGFSDTRSAVEAMRLGAVDVFEKPVDVDDVLSVFEITPHNPGTITEPEALCLGHATSRWIHAVIPVIQSATDVKTISAWARCVGASSGAIRNWCRTAGVRPKACLNLARMLRVVIRGGDSSKPEDMLDIVDLRALAKFLRLGDPTAVSRHIPRGVHELLDAQKWVLDPAALLALRRELRVHMGYDLDGEEDTARGGGKG